MSRLCTACGGDGFTIEPEHDSNCKGDCLHCPVPVQVWCTRCDGTGEIDDSNTKD